jgi:nitrous oxidase accessory protein NosD
MVMNSETGIVIKDSMYNTVLENWIEQNGCGVNISLMFMPTDNNLLYHNNFVSNVLSAYDICTNIWNASEPDGGNYWSDYTGVDADCDGIGDTAYVIRGGSNADYRPFMQPNGWREP